MAIVVCAGCAEAPPEPVDVAVRADAVCVPVWNPTWQEGSGANNYWVEYAISGGTVVSASLELPNGSRVTLANRFGKWVGGTSFIATNTQVIVHARNSLGQAAQTLPFPYFTTKTPVTDPCAGAGDDGGVVDAGVIDAGVDAGVVDAGVRDAGVIDAGVVDAGCAPPPWNAVWTQGSGANNWWVEFAISGSTVASASLELANGSRVTLASQFGKWVGSAPAAIARGSLVVVQATNTLGQAVRTVPFGYLDVTAPQTASCFPPPPPSQFNVPLATPSINGYTLINAFPGVAFSLPAAIAWPPNSAAPFVLERVGRIVRITGTTRREVVNFAARVRQVSEQGALGMALHPAFGNGTGPNAFVYVWYNSSSGTQRLARFTWNPTAQTFGAELVMLEEAEQSMFHNAGHLQFGPDGFLYFANGDDGNAANQQTISRALFAGMFRVDVDRRGGAVSHAPPRQPTGGTSTGYFIPNDNPFVGVPGANEEFWALGLRNPFGWSFDRQTGALWLGDVGGELREEVDLIVRGGNYQWPYRDGDIVLQSTQVTIGTDSPPVYTYPHAEMADLSAILGGFIYRGAALPELAGKYVYSDWPSGRVWALDVGSSPVRRTTLVDNKTNAQPMAVGEDNNGEIYLLQSGTISRLVRDTTSQAMPALLSQTGLFGNLATLGIDPSFVPYEVNSPLWSDGAAKLRWLRVPTGQRVTVNTNGTLTFPVGTIFVKHFELPPAVVPVGRTRRLETRVLVVASDTVYGVTYRWNAEGTDAQLVTEPTDETIVDTTQQSRNWHYPSLSQCWSCHRPENRVLGFNPPQLAMIEAGGTSQLTRLIARGVFAAGAFSTPPVPQTRPSDTSATLESRALSYLASNCGPCHHAGASYLGGGPTWNASLGVPLANRGLINAPHHNGNVVRLLGLPANAPLIAPGNPSGSLLLARMRSINSDLAMPPLTYNVVDTESAALIEAWIRSLP